jgi:hypothetical protein
MKHWKEDLKTSLKFIFSFANDELDSLILAQGHTDVYGKTVYETIGENTLDHERAVELEKWAIKQFQDSFATFTKPPSKT